jgi:hypothetical protein
VSLYHHFHKAYPQSLVQKAVGSLVQYTAEHLPQPPGCQHIDDAHIYAQQKQCFSAFWLAGWEPTTGALRANLFFGCPLLLETRVID